MLIANIRVIPRFLHSDCGMVLVSQCNQFRWINRCLHPRDKLRLWLLATVIPTIMDPSATKNYSSAMGTIIVGISVALSLCDFLIYTGSRLCCVERTRLWDTTRWAWIGFLAPRIEDTDQTSNSLFFLKQSLFSQTVSFFSNSLFFLKQSFFSRTVSFFSNSLSVTKFIPCLVSRFLLALALRKVETVTVTVMVTGYLWRLC